MKLIWVQLLNIELLGTWNIILVCLHMKLILQSIEFILLLLPVCLPLSIWKLLGIHLIQEVTVMSLEVGASLLINSSGMWAYTLTIFSAEVHIVLIYQCWILSAIKAHSIMLVTNWRETSHKRFILAHYVIDRLIDWNLLFHVVYYRIVFLLLGYTLQSFLSISISLERYQTIRNFSQLLRLRRFIPRLFICDRNSACSQVLSY